MIKIIKTILVVILMFNHLDCDLIANGQIKVGNGTVTNILSIQQDTQLVVLDKKIIEIIKNKQIIECQEFTSQITDIVINQLDNNKIIVSLFNGSVFIIQSNSCQSQILFTLPSLSFINSLAFISSKQKIIMAKYAFRSPPIIYLYDVYTYQKLSTYDLQFPDDSEIKNLFVQNQVLTFINNDKGNSKLYQYNISDNFSLIDNLNNKGVLKNVCGFDSNIYTVGQEIFLRIYGEIEYKNKSTINLLGSINLADKSYKQCICPTSDQLYIINNNSIIQYKKKSGHMVAQNNQSNSAKISSMVFRQSKLYIGGQSSIKRFITKQNEIEGFNVNFIYLSATLGFIVICILVLLGIKFLKNRYRRTGPQNINNEVELHPYP